MTKLLTAAMATLLTLLTACAAPPPPPDGTRAMQRGRDAQDELSREADRHRRP